MSNNLIDKLVNALRCLPGVGPKSAQRMAFYLLDHQKGRTCGITLANTLEQAIQRVGHCQLCRTLSETELCDICNNPRRNSALLCIVETPADIIAIEHTNIYSGRYFVLMGHLSPIDGIGPNELGIDKLSALLESSMLSEVIIATNPTVEGEATAHYLHNLIKTKNIKCSRLAYGIPLGGELEYVDSNTLARSLNGRLEMLD